MGEKLATETSGPTGFGPPDPEDRKAFVAWLNMQPRALTIALTCRAALRLIPLLSIYSRGTDHILQTVRANAIGRFAAKFPKREIQSYVLSAGSAATAAARATAGDNAAAARAAGYVAYAIRADDAGALATASASAYEIAVEVATQSQEIRSDAKFLHLRKMTASQLLSTPLWGKLPPVHIGKAWRELSQQLIANGGHWAVWIDWYDGALAGVADDSEKYHAAFTDVPGKLPWNSGAAAVDSLIARRLAEIKGGLPKTPTTTSQLDERRLRQDRLVRLAEVASPQPSLNSDGQLDAIPNQPFDVPTVDDDLSTLPIRQLNLIKIILSDLPKNAPAHLRASLKSYERELKARGAQPILPLLKDDADIIVAAVQASRADDEWLEPGQRKAFDKFDENHCLFVKHFPLDAERETAYAQTALDEERASGKALVRPLEELAEAAHEAHRAAIVTADFVMVVEKMTELARVLSTQPPNHPKSPAVSVSPEDRIQPITTKKRVIFGSLGFVAATLGIIAGTGNIATLNYSLLASRLKHAVEILSSFIP